MVRQHSFKHSACISLIFLKSRLCVLPFSEEFSPSLPTVPFPHPMLTVTNTLLQMGWSPRAPTNAAADQADLSHGSVGSRKEEWYTQLHRTGSAAAPPGRCCAVWSPPDHPARAAALRPSSPSAAASLSSHGESRMGVRRETGVLNVLQT